MNRQLFGDIDELHLTERETSAPAGPRGLLVAAGIAIIVWAVVFALILSVSRSRQY
jgi:hypothetical protein